MPIPILRCQGKGRLRASSGPARIRLLWFILDEAGQHERFHDGHRNAKRPRCLCRRAAVLGTGLLAVICVGVAVMAFTLLTWRRWGSASVWASRSAAIVIPGFLLTAAFPFLLGAALALLALLALRSRRLALFAV